MVIWSCSSHLSAVHWQLACSSHLAHPGMATYYWILNAIHWQLAQLLHRLTGPPRTLLKSWKQRQAIYKSGTSNQKTDILCNPQGVVLIRCALYGIRRFSVISTNRRNHTVQQYCIVGTMKMWAWLTIKYHPKACFHNIRAVLVG